MQDLDAGALDEAHLKQSPLKLTGGQTTRGRGMGVNVGDHARETTAAIGQGRQWRPDGFDGDVNIEVGQSAHGDHSGKRLIQNDYH